MNDKIVELLALKDSIEGNILNAIEELHGYGTECACPNPMIYNVYTYEDVVTYCSECGGTVEKKEEELYGG